MFLCILILSRLNDCVVMWFSCDSTVFFYLMVRNVKDLKSTLNNIAKTGNFEHIFLRQAANSAANCKFL